MHLEYSSAPEKLMVGWVDTETLGWKDRHSQEKRKGAQVDTKRKQIDN